MEQDALLISFKQELEYLTGEPCHGQLFYDDPLKIMLFFCQDINRAEQRYSIAVGCLWQLTHAGKTLCVATGGNDDNGQMEAHLNPLRSLRVKEVRLKAPAMNLYVVFENEVKLSIFPNPNSEFNYLFLYVTTKPYPDVERDKYFKKYGFLPDYHDRGGFCVVENRQIKVTSLPNGDR